MDLAAALAGRRRLAEASTLSSRGAGAAAAGDAPSAAAARGGSLGARAPRGPSGHAGLINQGATCYLNSLLQALFCDEELRAIVDWIGSDFFTPNEHGAFGALHHSLLAGGDPYKLLADFRSYSDCHARVDAAYRDQGKWAKMAILNTARMGKFSSDRTIREYARDIWRLPAVPVP